jgi:hypothetical protein
MVLNDITSPQVLNAGVLILPVDGSVNKRLYIVICHRFLEKCLFKSTSSNLFLDLINIGYYNLNEKKK